MPTLKLSLEEGFDKDHVVVSADGKVLADESDVTTRYQISLARLLDLALAGDEGELVVSLPERGLEARLPLAAGPPNHLRVSVARDGHGLDLSTEDPVGFA
ncbi:MAG TPA: hypothetical protein VGC46_03920 [Allosphingosinicella sp.]